MELSDIPCERCHKLGVCEEGMDVFVACLCQTCFDTIWKEYDEVMTRPPGRGIAGSPHVQTGKPTANN